MLTFSRVPTEHIEELMADSELVTALLEDMGFSLEDEPDENEILAVLERRWQGEEQNYTLEHYAEAAKLILLDNLPIEVMELLFNGGKASGIKLNHSAVCVLSPAEVHKIHLHLGKIDLAELQYHWLNIEKLGESLPEATAEEVDTCWAVFPGIFRFFQLASEQSECVVRGRL